MNHQNHIPDHLIRKSPNAWTTHPENTPNQSKPYHTAYPPSMMTHWTLFHPKQTSWLYYSACTSSSKTCRCSFCSTRYHCLLLSLWWVCFGFSRASDRLGRKVLSQGSSRGRGCGLRVMGPRRRRKRLSSIPSHRPTPSCTPSAVKFWNRDQKWTS